ncbi:MAG TPA: transglycosylase SLT domain-containing protein [Polyangia bacterium]|nr:transglycosylase SLT domain-containing protein [Polyangia bacterium]
MAAVAGFFALPLSAPNAGVNSVNTTTEEIAAAPSPDKQSSVQLSGDDSCMARTICAIKERIRWQTPAWTPSQCRRIAGAVSASAKKYNLSPTLILAVMINESDMNEKASRVYTRDNEIYAKDSGLMAIRCLLDKTDHCTNGNVRGMAWKDLMDPVTNVEAGARELAHWRDGGGITRVTINKRDAQGHLQRVTKDVPCQHKNHAFWAHYNHGPRYIDKGYPRHYPHRIAVLDHALATVMNLPAPELTAGRITIHDPGKRERTPDRPMEPRFKKLCHQIMDSASCSPVALNERAN